MATAKKSNVSFVEVVEKKVTKEVVTLTLSKKEAIILRTLTRHIAGISPERAIADGIGAALYKCDVPYLTTDPGDETNETLESIHFSSGPLFVFSDYGKGGYVGPWKPNKHEN